MNSKMIESVMSRYAYPTYDEKSAIPLGGSAHGKGTVVPSPIDNGTIDYTKGIYIPQYTREGEERNRILREEKEMAMEEARKALPPPPPKCRNCEQGIILSNYGNRAQCGCSLWKMENGNLIHSSYIRGMAPKIDPMATTGEYQKVDPVTKTAFINPPMSFDPTGNTPMAEGSSTLQPSTDLPEICPTCKKKPEFRTEDHFECKDSDWEREGPDQPWSRCPKTTIGLRALVARYITATHKWDLVTELTNQKFRPNPKLSILQVLKDRIANWSGRTMPFDKVLASAMEKTIEEIKSRKINNIDQKDIENIITRVAGKERMPPLSTAQTFSKEQTGKALDYLMEKDLLKPFENYIRIELGQRSGKNPHVVLMAAAPIFVDYLVKAEKNGEITETERKNLAIKAIKAATPLELEVDLAPSITKGKDIILPMDKGRFRSQEARTASVNRIVEKFAAVNREDLELEVAEFIKLLANPSTTESSIHDFRRKLATMIIRDLGVAEPLLGILRREIDTLNSEIGTLNSEIGTLNKTIKTIKMDTLNKTIKTIKEKFHIKENLKILKGAIDHLVIEIHNYKP